MTLSSRKRCVLIKQGRLGLNTWFASLTWTVCTIIECMATRIYFIPTFHSHFLLLIWNDTDQLPRVDFNLTPCGVRFEHKKVILCTTMAYVRKELYFIKLKYGQEGYLVEKYFFFYLYKK